MNRSQASLMRSRTTRHKLETKSIESDRIIIIINSMGGNTLISLNIIDEIEKLKTMDIKVYTIIYPYVASMASLIAIHGSEDCRYISNYGGMLLHQLGIPIQGGCSPRISQSMASSINLSLSKMWDNEREYLTNFNIPNKYLLSLDSGADIEFTTQDALEYSLVDYIID